MSEDGNKEVHEGRRDCLEMEGGSQLRKYLEWVGEYEINPTRAITRAVATGG